MPDFPSPVILQSAALSYRIDLKTGVQILLVTTSRARRWSIPKGNAEPNISLAQNAAKEAWEEAGVTGEISQQAAGMYRTFKRDGSAKTVIEVWVYLLRVTSLADTYPEQHRRRQKWVPAKEATRILREPILIALCGQLAKLLPDTKKP